MLTEPDAKVCAGEVGAIDNTENSSIPRQFSAFAGKVGQRIPVALFYVTIEAIYGIDPVL
jgi:hypothetical protein